MYPFFFSGFFVMSLVAYFLNHDWHLLQMVLTAPTVIFLSYWWLVPESIRWQISKEKYREARKQIIYVAEKNGCNINEVKDNFDRLIEQTKLEKNQTSFNQASANIYKQSWRNSVIVLINDGIIHFFNRKKSVQTTF